MIPLNTILNTMVRHIFLKWRSIESILRKKVIKKYHAYIIWQNVGSVIMENYEFEYDKKSKNNLKLKLKPLWALFK